MSWILTDAMDTVVHHYPQSIFNQIAGGSIEAPNNQSYFSPDWDRIKIWDEAFPWLPRWVYDFWHTCKFIFQWLIGTSLWLMYAAAPGEKWPSPKKAIYHYVLCLVIYAAYILIMHNVIFYDWLFVIKIY